MMKQGLQSTDTRMIIISIFDLKGPSRGAVVVVRVSELRSPLALCHIGRCPLALAYALILIVSASRVSQDARCNIDLWLQED